MKKINIGLFIDTFYPMIDGVILVVDNYAKRLSKYANVYVFAPKVSGNLYDDSVFNYKVIRCRSMDVFFLDYSLPLPDLDLEFKKNLDKCNLDIIHIHSPATIGNMGIKYAKKHNIPVVATLHSQYKQDFLRVTKSNLISNLLTNHITKLFEKCDECWTLNNEIAQVFKSEYGYRKKIRIINNATDMLPVDDKNKSAKKINKLHGITSDEKVLLFVGRINKLKNIDLIINSLPYLNNINYKMIFIGVGQDLDYFKNIIKKMKLDDHVILCGKVIDRNLLRDYYARSDLFLFPSLYDTNSLVQLEAASQSVPTLFVRGAVTASKVTEDIDGFFSNNNPKDYAKKIEDVFSDMKKYNEVCKNVFKNLYINWDDEVERIYSLYLTLINERRK